jgi:hypothetical protein
MTPFNPSTDDMAGLYAGVLVDLLGEGDGAIALTGDKCRALEAFDTYYRMDCGFPNLLDNPDADLATAYYFLDSGHAVFTRTPDGGWLATPAAADAPGAVPVTWFDAASATSPVPVPYSQPSGARLW